MGFLFVLFVLRVVGVLFAFCVFLFALNCSNQVRKVIFVAQLAVDLTKKMCRLCFFVLLPMFLFVCCEAS